ncbi:hypothetical protein NUU61_001741 [Penicillium alfredii]|uniref:Uncharacterized protein n=1 Tax=Penicillium alfredii TaxID=1506179 RepID=A0A9W9FQ89_9EURO|nr:uncharacterized protein NUU61_001741 [Penicillium alfredii]KAJ5104394.1 hypothetical protein NUU61_001741 [Penicillium alfredii]
MPAFLSSPLPHPEAMVSSCAVVGVKREPIESSMRWPSMVSFVRESGSRHRTCIGEGHERGARRVGKEKVLGTPAMAFCGGAAEYPVPDAS